MNQALLPKLQKELKRGEDDRKKILHSVSPLACRSVLNRAAQHDQTAIKLGKALEEITFLKQKVLLHLLLSSHAMLTLARDQIQYENDVESVRQQLQVRSLHTEDQDKRISRETQEVNQRLTLLDNERQQEKVCQLEHLCCL